MIALDVARSLALVILGTLISSAPPQDWSHSPEAYFLTPDEQREWKTLQSDTAREEFQRAYWKRRDPSPLTERNEFRDTIEARIRSADAQLTVGKIPGSRTARGLVLIVLGRPSAQQQTMGPLKNTPDLSTPGRISIPNESFATTEFHTWVYDRSTRADLLDVLGIAHLEVAFVVEPGHRDELQQPGRFQQWREIVARHSIVSGGPHPRE